MNWKFFNIKYISINNIKLMIIAKIRETCICSSSPRAASVFNREHTLVKLYLCIYKRFGHCICIPV
jgi:hypothetical protein